MSDFTEQKETMQFVCHLETQNVGVMQYDIPVNL